MVKISLKQDEHMTLDDRIKNHMFSALLDLNQSVLVANAALLSIRLQHTSKEGFLPSEDATDKRSIEEAKNSILRDSATTVPKWAFINLVAIFEAWMSDILRAILREYPKKIKRQDIKSFIITESSSYEECLEKLIDEELISIFYSPPKEVIKRFQEITSIDIGNISELADIFELNATRDILLHNKGIVNRRYLNKAGNKARAKEGEEIKIYHSALLDSHRIIRMFIKRVSLMLIQKFGKRKKQCLGCPRALALGRIPQG